jgi:hypothetical protein
MLPISFFNIGYHTSLRLAIESSYIFKRNVSLGPIKSFSHFVMVLTLSPRLWVAMLLSSTLHPSLVCIHYSMWTFFSHIFHRYWRPLRSPSSLRQQRSNLTAWNKNPPIRLWTHSLRAVASSGSNFIGLSR